MRLQELLSGVDALEVHGDPATEVSEIAYDSRSVRPGDLFVAMPGEQADGHDFVGEAVRKGAAGIVCERPLAVDVPWVRVRSGRLALAALAAKFFGYPTRHLCLIGVTGTNGKTTTAHLIDSVLAAAGHLAVLLGTAGHRGPGFTTEATLTTPEASDLERWFRRAVDEGETHAVMEVSSHAIAMRRTWGMAFDVAVFTNLSGDHLDFHGDMDSYFETKRQLFLGQGSSPPGLAVLNRDDPYALRLTDCGNAKVLTFGSGPDADVHPLDVDFRPDGTEAELSTPNGPVHLVSELVGRPNLLNISAAVAVSTGLGVASNAVKEGIRALKRVPGRFDRIERGQPFGVIVDYAHTDDALRSALTAVREITQGRVIVVFGAGGNRDTSKRVRMGEVAARYSDVQIVTSDNPRREDPASIVRMIEKGLNPESGNYYSIPDRRSAIRKALSEAHAGDTVLITGKGHETYQIIGSERHPFDDRAVAAELLDELDTGANR
jgi:UDP-N-acetylmuramoyl-L-alanyl-D-glutamate--2,6-diaminopimelate ligase